MLFDKIIKNHLIKTKEEYDRLIERRKERFLQLIEYDAPKLVIIKEIELLREPFYKFLIKKYINKFYKNKILL